MCVKCFYQENSKKLSPMTEEVLQEIVRWFYIGKYQSIDKSQLVTIVSNLPQMGYVDESLLKRFIENRLKF